jgi:dynein heavy chain
MERAAPRSDRDTPQIEAQLEVFSHRLVMFMDAISHVARITRVLRQPKGNMLLLGVGGSGRQSLSRLSTFMAECKIFSIEITKGYGLSEWC